jgi:hypothetical protein
MFGRIPTMVHYEGPATIRQGGVETGVQCEFTARLPTGMQRGTWHGRFTHAQAGIATGEATLVLPTGETGRVIIDRVNERGGRGGLFVGAGPPPGETVDG